MLLIGNGRVVTRDLNHPYYESGAVLISEDRVINVGPEADLIATNSGATYVDAHGGVIMPGLINAHTHMYSGLARGLSMKDSNPASFEQVLADFWWKIDAHLKLDTIRASAYATILDSIRNGVTTLFDHHASYGHVEGSLFALKDLALKLGIRSCLCFEVSDRHGAKKADAAIAENADFAHWAKRQNDDMIKALFGGHALFTLSDRTLKKMLQLNDGLAGYHIHVSEGINDVYDSLQKSGCRPIERLLNAGMLGPQTLLAHGVHVNSAEMDIIKRTKTMMVNSPGSNMNNAVGCAPVLQMMERGIVVGMGTDAYTPDILESLKTFLLIQRHHASLPNVGFAEDMQMAFQNNSSIAARYFQKPLGVLKPGAAADVVIMDYKPFTPFNAENIGGHILFGLEGQSCRTTIINGQILYKDRSFTNLDEEQINAWVLEQSKKLWSELNHRGY